MKIVEIMVHSKRIWKWRCPYWAVMESGTAPKQNLTERSFF